MYDKMMNILDQLEKNESFKSTKKENRSYFHTHSSNEEKQHIFYEHRNTIDELPEYHFAGIRYLQVHGINKILYSSVL